MEMSYSAIDGIVETHAVETHAVRLYRGDFWSLMVRTSVPPLAMS